MKFLPPAYVVRREVMFPSAPVCQQEGTTTSSPHNTSTGPMSFLRGVPYPCWGVPQNPRARSGPWSIPGYPLSRSGREYPPPFHQDRTAERAVATRRAVCLLRSRRRTVLFLVQSNSRPCRGSELHNKTVKFVA